MKKFFIVVLTMVFGSGAFAGGNFGGGGTGRSPNGEEVVVYFKKVDFDLVHFQVARYRDGEVYEVNNVVTTLTGLDTTYLQALKMSAEMNGWALVRENYRLPPAPPSAKRISNPNPM
jgi:hypothetical protein